MRKSDRFILLGGTLFLGGLLMADTPHVGHQNKSRLPSWPAQGLDRDVGRAYFSIRETHGDKMLITPLVPVDLLVTRTRGEDNPSERLVSCMVTRRTLIVSSDATIAVDLTVLKCPGNREYVSDQLEFDVDRRAPKNIVQ